MTGNLFPARLRESHQEKRLNTKFRRNGKLQACEPCRKGKLRCDHVMPSCGRCSRRNKSNQCVYHPAPLTKANNIPTPPPSSSDHDSHSVQPFHRRNLSNTTDGDSSSIGSSGLHQTTLQQPLPSLIEILQNGTTNAPTVTASSQSIVSGSENLVSRPDRFYLSSRQHSHSQNDHESPQGPPLDLNNFRDDALRFSAHAAFTNDDAILAENELSIGIQPTFTNNPPKPSISQSHIDKGAMILTLFKDFQAIQRYLDRWFIYGGGFVLIEPVMKLYANGIWSSWKRTIENQKPEDLRKMSETIWDNTLQPVARLYNEHTKPRDFFASVTGPGLRWEVVGMIVGTVSLLTQSMEDGDALFCSRDDAPIDRATLALQMHQGSEMCVSFCDEFSVLNDLYLLLLYANAMSHYNLCSIASFTNSRKVAALAVALQCCNLHQEPKDDGQTPFFLKESRKRLFTCAYAADKRFAMSAGMPPKLTRQYCQIQLPLDLTDDQFMSDGIELDNALGLLSEEGWNSNANIRQSTWARISAANALVTEEILELSLGSIPQEEIKIRAAEIQAKADKLWTDLPSFLRLQVNGRNFLQRDKSPYEHLVLSCIRFNHLEHRFRLQRTLSKKVAGPSDQPNTQLLSICEEIFSFALSFVEQRDYFRGFQVDFVAMLAVYGVPAAAVLAVELLHQERNPTGASALAHPLHRSETIQQLSVFVSCLSYVRKEVNGSRSCERGRRFLKKILDMILGSGPASLAETPSDMLFNGANDPTLGAPLLQPGSDGDFVKWLESMEWDQDVWVNFS